MKTPLIIIDMQPFFSTSKRPLKAVLDQIEIAKELNNPIILVEYENCGPSYQEIYDALDGYVDVIRVTKDSDGGGRVIADEVGYRGIDISNKIRVVGVNRSYCVYSTLVQLQRINKEKNGRRIEIEVPTRATWCSDPTFGYGRLKAVGCKFINR